MYNSLIWEVIVIQWYEAPCMTYTVEQVVDQKCEIPWPLQLKFTIVLTFNLHNIIVLIYFQLEINIIFEEIIFVCYASHLQNIIMSEKKENAIIFMWGKWIQSAESFSLVSLVKTFIYSFSHLKYTGRVFLSRVNRNLLSILVFHAKEVHVTEQHISSVTPTCCHAIDWASCM